VSFALDPRLAADTRVIGDLPLSRALLMNDARYPWVILVPRRAGLVEIADLDKPERAQLIEEIARVSAALRALSGVEKINVGALGKDRRRDARNPLHRLNDGSPSLAPTSYSASVPVPGWA
jgi:diadenosine tetraphosphate (Ap4A) HIT family hydrolase